eukprot:g48414.t1
MCRPEDEREEEPSEDEDDDKRRLNDELLGKVVYVDCNADKRKGWYPALDCNSIVQGGNIAFLESRWPQNLANESPITIVPAFFFLLSCEKWRHGEDLGKVLIVIDNVSKAAKNMASFLRSWEVLDDEGHPIRHILCLSSEDVITVFRCGMVKVAVDELNIVSY